MSTIENEGEKKGAGRHKLPEGEKKERIDIFVKSSIIENAGGIEQLKKDLYYFLGQK